MPTITGLREHGAEIVGPGAGRERRALGIGLAARPGAIEAVARAVCSGSCTSRRSGLKESGHGRQQVLRELFGLDGRTRGEAAAAGAERAADNVRPLKRRA
jgi:hypothetical protein